MPNPRMTYATMLRILTEIEPALPTPIVAEMAADLRAIITRAQRQVAQAERERRIRTRQVPGLEYVEGDW